MPWPEFFPIITHMTGDPNSVNRVYAIYDQITASQIQEVANKYFKPTNRTVVILTKDGAAQ